MSISSAPPRPSDIDPDRSEAKPAPFYGTPPWLHTAAIIVGILGPIGYFLPSRQGRATVTMQNAILGSSTFWAINQLAYDYSGKSIMQRSNERWASLLDSSNFGGLPERAQETKKLMDAERARRRLREMAARQAAGKELVNRPGGGGAEGGREEAGAAAGGEGGPRRGRGVLARLWMSDEDDDLWRKRVEADRRALETGKGYGDLIMEQLSEVWNDLTKGKEEKRGRHEDNANESTKNP